jgi:hypothetical protein
MIILYTTGADSVLKLHKSVCALRVEKDYKFCAVSEIMK